MYNIYIYIYIFIYLFIYLFDWLISSFLLLSLIFKSVANCQHQWTPPIWHFDGTRWSTSLSSLDIFGLFPPLEARGGRPKPLHHLLNQRCLLPWTEFVAGTLREAFDHLGHGRSRQVLTASMPPGRSKIMKSWDVMSAFRSASTTEFV